MFNTPPNTPPGTPPQTPTTSVATNTGASGRAVRVQAILTQSARRIQLRQTTMAANTIFLDGETPLTTARTTDDIAQLGVTVDGRAREGLKTTDAKTYQKKGIKTKLDHFDTASIADITFRHPQVSLSRNISVLLLTYAHSVEAKVIQLWPFLNL